MDKGKKEEGRREKALLAVKEILILQSKIRADHARIGALREESGTVAAQIVCTLDPQTRFDDLISRENADPCLVPSFPAGTPSLDGRGR